jgi:hypothetical protein
MNFSVKSGIVEKFIKNSRDRSFPFQIQTAIARFPKISALEYIFRE